MISATEMCNIEQLRNTITLDVNALKKYEPNLNDSVNLHDAVNFLQYNGKYFHTVFSETNTSSFTKRTDFHSEVSLTLHVHSTIQKKRCLNAGS